MKSEVWSDKKNKYTGARILIESLIENGVNIIFGYPGASVLNIYDELSKCKNRIRHILVSRGQHAAHAADGYARSTGKLVLLSRYRLWEQERFRLIIRCIQV